MKYADIYLYSNGDSAALSTFAIMVYLFNYVAVKLNLLKRLVTDVVD